MNRAVIAVAGAGKTYDICKEAIKTKTTKRILVTTFTNNGIKSIIEEYKKQNFGVLSEHVIVKSWFSFMLSDLIKPYQRSLTSKEYAVKGYNFTDDLPSFIYRLRRDNPKYYLDIANLLKNGLVSSPKSCGFKHVSGEDRSRFLS